MARNHGDHDALPYDGHNADLAHLCQVCGEPMPAILTEQQQRELAELIAQDDAQPIRMSDARLGRLQELLTVRTYTREED